MKNYLTKKGQSSIEFTISFVLAILFMILSCNLFVWLNHNIVQRQRGYEQTRILSGSGSVQGVVNQDGSFGERSCGNCTPGKLDFYIPKTMNLSVLGGYK